MSFDITSADTITSITSTITSAIRNGTRGNALLKLTSQTFGPTDVVSTLGITGHGTYNFGIALDGGANVPVTLTGITSQTTYAGLATMINAALIANNINAVCTFTTLTSSVGYYFASKTRGATSAVVMDTGTAGGGSYPLFATATEGVIISNTIVGSGITTGSTAGVAGIAVYPDNSSVLSVGIDQYTQRIRFISSTTGSASNIVITAGTDSADFITFMGGVKIAKAGQVATSLSAAINSSSGKIRISSVNTTVAPTVVDTVNADTLRFITFFGVDVAVVGTSAIPVNSADIVEFVATQYGTSGNLIQVIKSSAVNPSDSSTSHTIKVFYDGNLQETFSDVSLTITDSNYFVNVMNNTVENGGSAWVDVTVYNNDANTTITFPNGTYTLGVADNSSEIAYSGNTTIGSYNYKPGTDGIPTTGDPALFVNVLGTNSDLANSDYFNFHILLTPDDIEQSVQDAAIALAEYRKDCIYLVDPPFGLSYSQIVAWHNGLGYGRTNAVNSSYAAIYWPWLKTYDSYNKRYAWCPPSVFMVAKMMEVDRVYAPWFAPAGDVRGQITADDVETTVSFAQRELLYGDFNCVNPIVNFASKGLIVYGQKTAYRVNSSSNRVNVRRMVIYIKKLVKSALNSMLFEPNNSDSWGLAADLINGILEPIRQGGGLSQYQVVIDATTNTPDVIAQNMMNGIIKIVPTGTIEIIEMYVNIYQSGTVIQ